MVNIHLPLWETEETWIWYLAWEDPLEWDMASHSSILLALKNLPAMSETWVRFLGQEDPLKKGMATYSSIFFSFFFKLINLFYFTRLYWFCHTLVLPWRIPWTEEAGGLQSMGSQRVGHTWAWMYAIQLYPKFQQSFKINRFYFQLFYVCYCIQVSLVVASGRYSSCGARASSHRCGFLWHAGYRVRAQWLQRRA